MTGQPTPDRAPSGLAVHVKVASPAEREAILGAGARTPYIGAWTVQLPRPQEADLRQVLNELPLDVAGAPAAPFRPIPGSEVRETLAWVISGTSAAVAVGDQILARLQAYVGEGGRFYTASGSASGLGEADLPPLIFIAAVKADGRSAMLLHALRELEG